MEAMSGSRTRKSRSRAKANQACRLIKSRFGLVSGWGQIERPARTLLLILLASLTIQLVFTHKLEDGSEAASHQKLAAEIRKVGQAKLGSIRLASLHSRNENSAPDMDTGKRDNCAISGKRASLPAREPQPSQPDKLPCRTWKEKLSFMSI